MVDEIRLTNAGFNRDFWIDMESGVRTGDDFDLAKVRAVLEACDPLIHREAA